jgi:hypothetical protein
MSYGGRLLLLRTCLCSIPLYMLSLFMLPKCTDKIFDFFVKRVLWNEKEGIKKYHLVN